MMNNKLYRTTWQHMIAMVLVLTGLGFGSQVSLAQGNAAAGEGKIALCATCHGTSGNESVTPDAPKIGGQNEKYLLKQLVEFKNGTRASVTMSAFVAALDDQGMADIAAWFASQPVPQGAADPELVALGETIYRAGIADIGVAACTACHSPTGNGNESAGYPALSGQDAAYTILQLNAFRDGSRQNDEAEVMRTITARLQDTEIEALASYISGLR